MEIILLVGGTGDLSEPECLAVACQGVTTVVATATMITVGGPEAMTKTEAVALVEEATGRRMKVQHMPRPIARMAIRVLNKRNDALASAFGAGLLQDLRAADWDDGQRIPVSQGMSTFE